MADILPNNGAPTTGTQAGDVAAGLIANNTYSPNISATQITPQTPVVIPPAIPEADYKSIMASVVTDKAAVKDTQDKITTDTTKVGQESTDKADFESQDLTGAGSVASDKAGLRDLNAQLTSLNNEANAAKLKVENQPIELGSIHGQQATIERERTIKALGISSMIQAMNGNLTTANDAVTKALALKYDPIKAEITTLTKQLDYNYKNLTESQKEKADAIKVENDKKLKTIEAKVASDKVWATTKNTALANGAPLKTVQKAEEFFAAGNEDAARALLTNYTGAKNAQISGYDENGNPIYYSAPKKSADVSKKMIDGFNKDLSNSAQLMRKANPLTREQFARQLQAKYPGIKPEAILREVYNTYPDNYNK